MIQEIIDLIDLRQVTTGIVAAIPQLLAALVIVGGFYIAFRVTRRPAKIVLERAGFNKALIRLLIDSLYRYTLLIVSLVMAADQLGIDVGAALAGLGVAGIAIGFAARDSLSNIISGILIFWDKPFIVGDWVTVADEYGEIQEITLRTTRIRTPRNTYVVIPNTTMIDSVLENHSKHGELRVDVSVGIAYKEDIPKAREVILGSLGSVDWLRDDPEPDVVVEGLGDSSVNLSVRVWIDAAAQQRKTGFAVVEAAKLALDDAGIEIPFPHLQLFLDNIEEPVWERLEAMRGAASTRPTN